MVSFRSLTKRVTSFRPHTFFRSVKKRPVYRRTESFLIRRPFTGFLIGLAMLFGIILLGNYINSLQRPVEEETQFVKDVQVYDLQTKPTLQVQAKVEKAGVVQILAQSAGVVQNVHYKEGQSVSRGQTLVTLSTNYQGGNAPALQYQLANTQYKNVSDTFATQKDIIAKQREIAEKTDANASEMRKIAEQSANDTQSLLDLNEQILTSLDQALQAAEASGDPAAINGARQAKAQAQAGVVQLRSTLRNLEYQENADKPAAQLGVLQKDIALKQLEIQEKALTLSLESARIQRDLAGVAASLMTPASPCGGTIERIFVKPGDTVAPGTPIATIKTDSTEVTLEALVPADIATSVAQSTPSTVHIGATTLKLTPFYVSREATNGQLYSVLYSLSEESVTAITDGEYVIVELPIGYQMTQSTPYVPLESVYQTQREAYVFVVENNRAVSRTVNLGDVYGNFVTVQSGLKQTDRVIENRNVIAGDRVRIIE